MKKSQYKYQIAELNRVIANLIDKVVEVSEKNVDIEAALHRRRMFCKTMEDLVNRDQPKSMKDMAKVIMDHASKNDGG
jgi:hypothetical protein